MRTLILLAIVVSLGLTGCGKRPKDLDPPPGAQKVFPKQYPPADSPGTRL